MRQDDLVDLDTVSDELYGLQLEEFTPARTVRERQATSAGDKDLAAHIHQLGKPNLVAWLANQLVRECADEIRSLLELGAALREATATSSGEQLRELSRQQRQLVYTLVLQARRLANAAGRKVSPDAARGLEDTLRAALADPDAADTLSAGRLTEGMQNSGFGSQTGREELPVRPGRKPATAAAPSVTVRQPSEQRKRAEHDVDQAQSAAYEAITAREASHDQLKAADQMVTDTGGRVERARGGLDEALQAQSEAQKKQRRARAAFDLADREARDAQRQVADATERLDQLAP
jgi:hypothetical protein